MKGYTFYLEYIDKRAKRAGQHTGCILVAYGDSFISQGDVMRECIGVVFDTPNSGVCSSSVSIDYLREKCKRISEVKARAIHPALFYRLDWEG